jgi:hypothetical protein
MRWWVALQCLTFLACGGDDTRSGRDSGRADSGGGRDSGGGIDSGAMGFDSGPPDTGPPDTGPGCEYPLGGVEPMMRNMTLWHYAWPEAIDGMGRNFPIDLEAVACTADENIDWSPFDVLVFIAIPAW